MKLIPRRSPRPAVGVLVAMLVACGDPAGPVLPQLELIAAAGDGQFAGVGQTVSTPLHALVRTAATGRPREGVTVRWTVESGDASFVTGAATASDSTGSVFATVRFGASAGDIVIRARAVEQETAAVSFTLHAVDRPLLQSLSVAQAESGGTVTLLGANFLPDAATNVVLFSGVRGEVVSASAGELSVVVPACLPSRAVSVKVMLGALESESLSLSVMGQGSKVDLAVGGVIDVDDPSAPGCLRLEGGGRSYLAMAYSAGTIGAARYQASFTGLAEVPSAHALSPGSADREPAASRSRAQRPTADDDAQADWDRRLRMDEADPTLADSRQRLQRRGDGPRDRGPRRVPSVGEQRTFNVLNGQNQFDQVVAEVLFVGEQAVMYVDTLAPAGGFTASDLAAFSDTFDEMIFPSVTGAFGEVPDLDGNERVVILFTTTVNELSPAGSGGFVGGFFYGVDLLTDVEGSNQGEIFYGLVPDPSGKISRPHPKVEVLDVTPAILAHELQHMIHFNQRTLVQAADKEALWLSEGLAQMAEEVVARAYDARGVPGGTAFRKGNLARARLYLSDPLDVSLLVNTGQGTLEERGAGWLHVLYLDQRYGGSILRRLTASTRAGVENVTFETGLAWRALLADWWAAVYLDGRGDFGPELGYGPLGLRTMLSSIDGTDALSPVDVGRTDFREDFSLWSSSVGYYILTPAPDGSTVVRLGGEGGGSASAGSALGLRIVRLF